MTCLKIHRPATSDVGETLAKVKALVTPDLADLLDDDNPGEIRVTTHIQDGVVNHHAVEVQTLYDLIADKVDWSPPADTVEHRTAEAMAAGLRSLKPRLLLSLKPGYHGFTLLQLNTRGRALHSVVCLCREVHRVQSGRVPT